MQRTGRRFPSRFCMAMAVGLAMSWIGHHAADASELHGGDIGLLERDGQIITGGVEDDAVRHDRVFNYNFGNDGFINAADVGYDSPPGEFDSGSRLGFNIRDSLHKWVDPNDGFESLSPDTDEYLEVNFGGFSATSGEGFSEGFDLGVSSSGQYHVHYWYSLRNPEQGALDDIYLAELERYSTDSSLEPSDRPGEYGTSDPFWIVMGHVDPDSGDPLYDEEVMNDAVTYVQDQFLAEPLLGDLTDDGFVGGDDLDLVLGNWGADADDVPEAWVNFRPEAGEIVGGDELDLVLGNWGASAEPASVPEPGSAALLGAAMSLLWCYRRRGGVKTV